MTDSIEQTGQDTSSAAPLPVVKSLSPGFFATIRNFFREVYVELRKTNWPSGNELIKFTVVVIVTIIVVAIALGLMDYVAAFILQHLIRQAS